MGRLPTTFSPAASLECPFTMSKPGHCVAPWRKQDTHQARYTSQPWTHTPTSQACIPMPSLSVPHMSCRCPMPSPFAHQQAHAAQPPLCHPNASPAMPTLGAGIAAAPARDGSRVLSDDHTRTVGLPGAVAPAVRRVPRGRRPEASRAQLGVTAAGSQPCHPISTGSTCALSCV